MDNRIQQELTLLRTHFAEVEYVENGRWVRIPAYSIPANPVGWNRTATDAVFQILPTYPATPPYGIYVPAGIRFNNVVPGNYTEPAPTCPPFPGTWAIFSWTTQDGLWFATANITSGRNLLNWVQGFADRFREGA